MSRIFTHFSELFKTSDGLNGIIYVGHYGASDIVWDIQAVCSKKTRVEGNKNIRRTFHLNEFWYLCISRPEEDHWFDRKYLSEYVLIKHFVSFHSGWTLSQDWTTLYKQIADFYCYTGSTFIKDMKKKTSGSGTIRLCILNLYRVKPAQNV